MARLPDGCADLVYIDPPFNTGHDRVHTRLRTVADADGDRAGFAGRRYRSVPIGTAAYADVFDDYLAFLEPRLRELRRLMAAHASIYVHADARESHYVKVLGDLLFGRENFLNEVVWAYDYGGRTRRRWAPKHDVLLVWVRDRHAYWFDDSAVDRIPYMAPGLVGPEKAARGKVPTDTWWHTVVPTAGPERTGYPTQKPLGVLRRVVAASCPPGGVVLDVFAGSGSAGAAALELGRRFLCVDSNPQAIAVMRRRFAGETGILWVPGADL
ncbi:MAG TPA: site-specific DNA-methyltransferase [Candidatus Dormibacteraeota bacterium]|nr:site-specific DNA-methyltransferase [Candidatus Dormibacteraeota bacterium]